VRAYGQVRHALQYLRREKNDADRYAPSLYGRRRSRKAKAFAVAVTQKADAQAAAVEPGARTQSAAIAPSANAPLPVEQVPEQQQEASFDVDAPHVSASASASRTWPRELSACVACCPAHTRTALASCRSSARGYPYVSYTVVTPR